MTLRKTNSFIPLQYAKTQARRNARKGGRQYREQEQPKKLQSGMPFHCLLWLQKKWDIKFGEAGGHPGEKEMFFKDVFTSFVGVGGLNSALNYLYQHAAVGPVSQKHGMSWSVTICMFPLNPLMLPVPPTPYWPSPASVSMGLFVL